MTSEDDFIIEAQLILERHHAAVVYIHNAEGNMVAALVKRDTAAWVKMNEAIVPVDHPSSEAHSHIEPGEE